MLCVPLWVHERCLGELRLYAEQAAAFTDLQERVTTLLATFAALALAVALAEAQHAEQLIDALGNRDVKGQERMRDEPPGCRLAEKICSARYRHPALAEVLFLSSSRKVHETDFGGQTGRRSQE
jgi:transcriptional regulator with GAF, ATPase, and Fis domain